MKVGVLTKSGIQFSSKPILLEAGRMNVMKDNENPAKKFENLKDKLILSDTGRGKTRLSVFDKTNLFNEILALLQTSHKNSMLSFIYSNELELIKSQNAFIELGVHCLTFSEYVDFDQRELYYNTLCAILKRSELDLGQLGF
jgi:hypothetical protein